MRIGIDIRPLLEAKPSGVSEYTWQMVKHLLQIDHANQYLLFYNSATKKIQSKYYKAFEQPNVTIIRWRWPNKLFNFLIYAGIFPDFDKRLGGLDVIFFPNLHFAKWSQQCRSFITVHDVSYKYPNFFSTKGRFWHHFVRPGHTLRTIDHVMAVSENTKNEIQKFYGLPVKKITVVYSGSTLPQTAFDDHPLPVKAGDYFLYLGNIEKRKNIHGLLLAWRHAVAKYGVKQKLILAGNIIDKQLPKLFPEAIFLGYIDESIKVQLLRQAMAFIYPSFYEGFGFPVLEAFACGCPVIASHGSSLVEVAGNAALLINPYNINEISLAIKHIAADQKLRQTLAARGKLAVQKFSWQATARQTLMYFNQ